MPVVAAKTARADPTSSMPRVYPAGARAPATSAGTLVRMRRRPLESGAIASAGYDPALSVLELEFTSGDVYRYYAVPPSVHRALLGADSAGRYFREHIRDVYPTEHRR